MEFENGTNLSLDEIAKDLCGNISKMYFMK